MKAGKQVMDPFCTYLLIIHDVGCLHSCHQLYTSCVGTPCFHLYGMQLSCFLNEIQYMKPVLPVDRSIHKIPNGCRITCIWILVLTCNSQNYWCPDHLNNCCIFLATLKGDQEQGPPNQVLWCPEKSCNCQLCGLVGSGKNPNALPFLHQKERFP